MMTATLLQVLLLLRDYDKNKAVLYELLRVFGPAIDRYEAAERQRAQAATLRASVATTPQHKASRTRRLNRMNRDNADAAEFAALIRGGHTTESARQKMKMGAVRAWRIRAIAVENKWIRPRQRKAGAT